MTVPIIEANRVRLRTLEERDVDGLFDIFSDPQVMRYWSSGPMADRDEAVKLFKEIQQSNSSGLMIKWGLALKENDLVIGTTTLFNLSLSNGRAEIGYAMNRNFWGQGLMNEALIALINYGFDTMNLRRFEADVDPRNGPSVRTLERLGFQREGFLRERWHVEGEIQDAFFYGLLKQDWSRSTVQEQEKS